MAHNSLPTTANLFPWMNANTILRVKKVLRSRKIDMFDLEAMVLCYVDIPQEFGRRQLAWTLRKIRGPQFMR